MNGRNIRRITALILVTVMAFALTACGGKNKADKFLEKFEALMNEYAELMSESSKNPEDVQLKAQLDKMKEKVDKSVEEAKKIRETLDEDEQKQFDGRIQTIFMNSLKFMS